MSKTNRIHEAVFGIPAARPVIATPSTVTTPAWARGAAVVMLLGLIALVIVAAIRMPSLRPAQAAPAVVPALFTPIPTPIPYPTILAAFPNAQIKHGYTLMCQGQVWEFASVTEVWAFQRQSGYAAKVCKCFLPRNEGQGYRECTKE